MPKVVDVKLVGISFDDFGGTRPNNELEIAGRIFGITFNLDPHEEKSRKDIFTFPEGPIRVVQDQMVPIEATAAFLLSTPGTEPERLNGKFLTFGGELSNLGNGFHTISTFDIVSLDAEQPHRVRIVSGNLEVRLDFLLRIANFF